MSALLTLLQHAARTLWRRPAASALLVATLALGIGANAAIFGVVRGVLLKPLAFPDPDGVVTIWSTNHARGWTRNGVSRQDAADWVASARSFDAIGTYTSIEGNVVVGRASERVGIVLADAGVFRALRVAPQLGRPLASADDVPDAPAVAVVSHAFWRRALGGSPAAVGQAIVVDGQPLTVVGVMPAQFDFPDTRAALWRPFGASPDATGPRIARWVSAVARLRPGVDRARAESELSTIAARLARTYPESNRDVGVLVEPRLRAETGDVRPLLLVAWGMVGLVLVMVATNGANLLLARAAEREGEAAVRAALGASGAALVAQRLAESVVLAGAAGLAGCVLATAAVPLLRRLDGVGVPRLASLGVDLWVLAYTITLSLGVGVAFGVAPALGAARTPPGAALRRAGRGAVARAHERARERVRAMLIVAQVAVAAVVLVAAGLLLRSFDRLARVEPGVALDGRVTLRLAPDWGTYPERADATAFYDRVLARVTAMPGTRAVAAVNRLPLTGSWWTTDYGVDGRPVEPGKAPTASYRVVTPGYFSAIGIPVLRGRAIDATDRADARLAVVVSRTFARQAWPAADPLGRRVTFDPLRPSAPVYTVVGVVEDVHTSGLAQAPEPLAYVALPQATFGHFGDWGMDIVVQTRLAPSAAITALRRELAAAAPAVPAFEARPLADLVARDLARRRYLLRLLTAFAATAALLAGVGLYGVVAHGVARRRGELGVRFALGAATGAVRRAVVARGVALAALGTAIGLPLAAVVGRLMRGLLYDVQPLDAATFLAVGAALLVVAGIAAWVPAFRASRVSPVDALRGD